MSKSAILLFSGGIDSTLTALILTNRKTSLIGLSINYKGRPRKERDAAKEISKHLDLDDFIEISIDSNHSLTKPEFISTKYEGWIPYRNLLFWTIGANQAVLNNANIIAAGHHTWDGHTFNDAGRDFFDNLSRILAANGNSKLPSSITFELPLLDSKEEFIDEIAVANKDVLEKTWSCWRNMETPCYECYACNERREYFDEIF